MEGNERGPTAAMSRTPYVSLIKLYGCPILPPCMDATKRLEMQLYKEKAIAVERCLEEKQLRTAAQEKRISFDSGVSESLVQSCSELSEACYTLSSTVHPKPVTSETISFQRPALSTINSTRQPSEENVDNSLTFTQTYQSFPLLSESSQYSLANTIENRLYFDSVINEQSATDRNDNFPQTLTYNSNRFESGIPLVDGVSSNFEDGLKYFKDTEYPTSANTTGSTDINQYLDLTLGSIESPIRGIVRQQDFSLSELSFDKSLCNKAPDLSVNTQREPCSGIVPPELFLKSPNVSLSVSPGFRNKNLSTSQKKTEDVISSKTPTIAIQNCECIDVLDKDTNAETVTTPAPSILESLSQCLEKEIDALQAPTTSVVEGRCVNTSKETIDLVTPTSECVGEKSAESLSIPPFVRQNSYTLLDGPSPLILAHMEKSKQENVNSCVSQRYSSQDSVRSLQSGKNYSKSSKTSSKSVSRSGSDSPPGGRSGRKGWNLAQAKEFWSSTDAINQLFAVPKVPDRKIVKKSSSGSSVPSKFYRIKSLPNSLSASPAKQLLDVSGFGSVDCIRTKNQTSQKPPTRRSLFTGNSRPSSFKSTSSFVSRRSSSTTSLISKQKNKSPESRQANKEKGSPRKKDVSRSGAGKPEIIHSLKKVPGSLNLAAAAAEEAPASSRRSSECGDRPRGVADLIQRLQDEHEKQMALLLEKQRADQEKMRQDFKIQEEKLLTDIIQRFPELERHFVTANQELVRTKVNYVASTNTSSTTFSADVQEGNVSQHENLNRGNTDFNAIPAHCDRSEYEMVHYRNVNIGDGEARRVGGVTQDNNVSNVNIYFQQAIAGGAYTSYPTRLSDQINPNIYQTFEELTLSQRNSYNSRRGSQIETTAFDELTSQKENICDSYANSDVNSFVKSPRGPASTFRQLHQNGQTLPAKAERENETPMVTDYGGFSPSVHSTVGRSHQGSNASVGQRQATTYGEAMNRSASELSSECTINLSSDFTESRLSTPSWRVRLAGSNETMIQERVPRYSAIEQAAASRIVSAAKGYLVRRLMKTGHVQNIIRTINDVTVAAVELHQENAVVVNQDDVELSRRLIHQLNASWLSFYDTFFSLSTAEQMSIIAVDRANLQHRQLRPQSVQKRLSAATQRSLQRKQNKNREDTSPRAARRSSTGSSSIHRSRSVHSRYSVMSASADSARSDYSAAKPPQQRVDSSRKPWR